MLRSYESIKKKGVLIKTERLFYGIVYRALGMLSKRRSISIKKGDSCNIKLAEREKKKVKLFLGGEN